MAAEQQKAAEARMEVFNKTVSYASTLHIVVPVNISQHHFFPDLLTHPASYQLNCVIHPSLAASYQLHCV